MEDFYNYQDYSGKLNQILNNSLLFLLNVKATPIN